MRRCGSLWTAAGESQTDGRGVHRRTDRVRTVRRFLFPLTIRLALFSLGVALADLFFQRWKFQRDLRMTPEEVRREQREEERKSPPRHN